MRSQIIEKLDHLLIHYPTRLDKEEILAVLARISSLEQACGHPLPEIVDLRGVRENAVSAEDELEIVSLRKRQQMDGRGRVIAFVVETDDQFENTMGYMHALAARHDGFRVAQFFTIQDAEAWILQKGYWQREDS